MRREVLLSDGIGTLSTRSGSKLRASVDSLRNGWKACAMFADPSTWFSRVSLLLALGCGGGGPSDGDTTDAPEDAPDSSPDGDAGAVASCDPINGATPLDIAPTRRGDMAFAADPACHRVYMFFGDEGEPQMCDFPPSIFVDDVHVYEMDTGAWYQLTPANTGPLPRARSAAIWDSARGQAVVFGGRWRAGSSGAYTFLNDVWAFDPTTLTWEELFAQSETDGPAGRMNFGMVADPDEGRFLVHAGGTTDFIQFYIDSDTWAFDLETHEWSEIGTGTEQPPARLFQTTALDQEHRRLYVFGGGGPDALTSPTFYQDLWYLDLGRDEWFEVEVAGEEPAGRIKGAMDYDALSGEIVLFGGHTDRDLGNANDLWTFSPGDSLWTQRIEGDLPNDPAGGFCDFPATFATIDDASPERRESQLFVIDRNRATLFGGRTDCGLVNDTWSLDLENHVWEEINTSFTGLTCFRSGRTDCEDDGAGLCG